MKLVETKHHGPPPIDGFQIAEALPCIVWIAGTDGRIDWLNQEFLRYTGLTFQAALGWGWFPRVHLDDLQSIGNGPRELHP